MANSQMAVKNAPDLPSSVPRERRPWLSDEQIAAIRKVEHFARSEYSGLNLNAVIDDYMYSFVEPLLRLNPNPSVVADIGAGYGWLAFAFALRTNARVIVAEYFEVRLDAARQIAEIIGVADRMEWINASIASLPIPDKAVDAAYCIEVIEHTGIDPAFVRELARITRDVLVITSPNKLFPIIGHDTVLPFCHWLPLPMRDRYARLFKRSHLQHNNLFWTPGQVFAALPDFQRVSSFLQFENYAQYRAAREHLGGRGGVVGLCKHAYYSLVGALGRFGIYVTPNLASTYRRKA